VLSALSGTARASSFSAMKRLIDLFVVTLALPFWGPILLLTAAVVRWRLGRPVLFRQKRPGWRAIPFELLKFRTMTNECDAQGNPVPDAARLTRFGRFFRSTSLDELPELINVLKGDMSLGGPRPLLMEYLERYSPEQARRHEVRPGLTGWAQIHGRNAVTWERRFELDVWYVDHRTLWLDIRILASTLVKVLKREGISATDNATMPKFTGTPATPPASDLTH
jgi:lipopolysaccharide/colanic/teichoic acid biosynthesis glycosyltransferase